MGLINKFFGSNEWGYIGSPEASGYTRAGLDREAYGKFLEEARLLARVAINDDDQNLVIAEQLTERTEMNDDQALEAVIRTQELLVLELN